MPEQKRVCKSPPPSVASVLVVAVVVTACFLMGAHGFSTYKSLILSATPTVSLQGLSITSSGNIVAVGAPCQKPNNPVGGGTATSTGATVFPTASAGCNPNFVQIYTCTPACSPVYQIIGTNIASNLGESCFGYSVALTNMGQFLAVGAPCCSSSAGAVVFFSLTTTAYTLLYTGYGTTTSTDNSFLGYSVAVSMVGTTVYAVAGAPGMESGGISYGGYQAYYFASTATATPLVGTLTLFGGTPALFSGMYMSMAPGTTVFAASTSFYSTSNLAGAIIYSCTVGTATCALVTTNSRISLPSNQSTFPSTLTILTQIGMP